MVVQSHGTIRKSLFTDRIECTTDRLNKLRSTSTASLFQSTETTVLDNSRAAITGNLQVIVASEDTVLTTYDARYQVTLLISIGHPLLINYSLGRCTEVTPHRIDAVFYLHHLIKRDRSTRISLHAADAMTHFKVTAKLFCEDVG
jgi:hypothetical protein